jgi:hypothetical protein
MILLGAMVVIAGVITFILTPRTIALQQAIFTAGTEDAKKAALDQFFQTHHLARGLYVLNLALGIGLVAVRQHAAMPMDHGTHTA